MDASHAKLREPKRFPDVPVRPREVFGALPDPGLKNRNLVTLLGETESAHASAESRADDDDVVGIRRGHGCIRSVQIPTQERHHR